MSAYNEIKTNIKDADLLCDALKEMGFKEVEKHEEPVNLVGYHGDTRNQTAEVVVRRKHVGSASNDIGFKKQDGGFIAIISSYDRSKYNEAWQNNLQKKYAELAIKKEAKKQGLRPLSRKEINGKIQLIYTKA
jgi:hypothetical protein